MKKKLRSKILKNRKMKLDRPQFHKFASLDKLQLSFLHIHMLRENTKFLNILEIYVNLKLARLKVVRKRKNKLNNLIISKRVEWILTLKLCRTKIILRDNLFIAWI